MRPDRPPEPILHVDMDAFYASVAQRDDPALRGRPVLVGGTGGRGVVAAASYEARTFGARSAMPMARALRLVPGAVVVAPDFERYAAASSVLMEVLRDVTPLVEPLSLDEAFCDVGGSVRLLGQPVDIGHALRRRIRDELDLPASVGVAPNKFLAKLCSDKAKPDGLLHLRADDVAGFLGPLDVRDLWGVGPQTAERLGRFGLRMVADITTCPRATLERIVGVAAATHLADLASGRDPRRVTPHEATKSISAEETFNRDVDDRRLLGVELLRLAEKVAPRIRRAGLAARTVTLKLRHADFTTITRSTTLAAPTDSATTLHEVASELLDALRLERIRVRLIGLAAQNLVADDAARQLDLLADDRWTSLERAADSARARFGAGVITRGALIDDDRPGAAPGLYGPGTGVPNEPPDGRPEGSRDG